MLRPKYKNLVIIGNGFDRWQNLPTSYEQFRLYYAANEERVMAELGMQKHTVTTKDGSEKQVTAVELIYGNPFSPDKLPYEFFWNFETALDKLNDQQLNYYFGRSKAGLVELNALVTEAQKLLRTLFCRWVREIEIRKEESGFCFPPDCFFINFNYTDTLEKRFGIERKDICHIHGNAESEESIIVGHATHPETAFRELVEQRFMTSLKPGGLPRLEGLYAIEDALYRTDKHVEDNLDRLCKVFLERGVQVEEIENIYVLGHSFGEPDLGYFAYLDQVTRCGCNFDALSAAERLDTAKLALLTYGAEEAAELILMEMIQRNIEYAVHHRDRVFAEAPSLYPELDRMDAELGVRYDGAEAARAVKQRFLYEQAGRTHELLEKLAKEYGLSQVPEGCHSVLGFADFIDGGHSRRKKNANWHITYFSAEDERRIKKVMKRFGQKRVTLYPGIDKIGFARYAIN